MASSGAKTGKLLEIKGVVVDAVFPNGLPDIYSAVRIPRQEGYHETLVRLRGQTTPREAALVVHRLPTQWLISGRLAGEGYAIRATLERSLPICSTWPAGTASVGRRL